MAERRRPGRKQGGTAALALALGATLGVARAQAPLDEGLDTVVITAQYRPQRVQDVPMAVTVFSAARIEEAGIRSPQEVADLTPNLAFDQSYTHRNSFLTIRGVSQVNNADAPVTVVIDGVPQNNQKQLKMALFDLERIEVLKGPQGALYGRNALGGAINIETRQPTRNQEGYAEATLAEDNARAVTAGWNAASADGRASLRIAAHSERSDGEIANRYSGRRADGVDYDDTLRVRAAFQPAPGVRLDLVAVANRFDAAAAWDSLLRNANPNVIVDPAANLIGKSDGASRDASFKAEIDTALGTLTAISAYSGLRERNRGDLDFSNPGDPQGGLLGALPFQVGQGQDLQVHMLSQELRLTSPSGVPLRWIAGVYYLKTRRDLDTRAFVDTDGSLNQWDDLAKLIVHRAEANDNRAYAGFGQFDLDLGARTTLSGALRFDRDERRQLDLLGGERRALRFDAWQPKVVLSQRLDRTHMLYLSYGNGFRSGGFNAPGLPDFGAERLTTAEAGAKLTLLDGRLLLNGALFQARSRNFQFFYIDAGSGSQVISNIDRVRIQGADLELHWTLAPGWSVEGGLGVADSKIVENAREPDTVGNRTPKSTPWKL
ncbi:MAG TPA: TonB-dependent receptor, partial [Telluria sp.]|nr:TonB-dependent receptor [Telluria sp.]